MSALVREAGLAVVREMMTLSPPELISTYQGPANNSSTSNSSISNNNSILDNKISENLITDEQRQRNAAFAAAPKICARHFEKAFGKVRASVSDEDRRRF